MVHLDFEYGVSVSASVCKSPLGGTSRANLPLTVSDCLEPLLNIVVYSATMISANKTSHLPKSASLPSFRQRMSYVLALLFVFVSLNPAQAGMAMGQGMKGVAMDISDSTVQSAMAFNDTSHSHSDELAGEGSTGHTMNMATNMAMNMSDDDCQSDCDCCPGLCSVYLPSSLNASTFHLTNVALADSAFLGKISTSTPLFRPPISH